MTLLQVRFVKEYLRDNNATAAMVRAGYFARTANKNSATLMRHPEVRKLIDAGLSDRNTATRVAAVDQVENLTRAARADLLAARDQMTAVSRMLRDAAEAARDMKTPSAVQTHHSAPAKPAPERRRPAGIAPAPARPASDAEAAPARLMPELRVFGDWGAPEPGASIAFADGGQSSFAPGPYSADPLCFLANTEIKYNNYTHLPNDPPRSQRWMIT